MCSHEKECRGRSGGAWSSQDSFLTSQQPSALKNLETPLDRDAVELEFSY
jgi:hypothetical protein